MTETRNFKKLMAARWATGARVCVGLDPDLSKVEGAKEQDRHTQGEIALRLCMKTVDETSDLALAYKPNFAFFAGIGAYSQLIMLIQYINKVAPSIPVILDAKRGDIGNTNNGYVDEAFALYQADALTVHPTLGYEAMMPFLADPNKFVFVLCKTSNKGGGEFQDRWVWLENEAEREAIQNPEEPGYARLYQLVAYNVATGWNANQNVGLVVGATYPEQLAKVREIVGDDMWVLVPGVGTQGGDAEATVKAGGDNIAVNASSSIMFGKRPARHETIILTGTLLAAG